MRKNELLNNYVKFKGEETDYSKVWKVATIYEKAWIVRLAEEKFPGIMAGVIVFVDLCESPEWDQIDEEHQKHLSEIMEEWISY